MTGATIAANLLHVQLIKLRVQRNGVGLTMLGRRSLEWGELSDLLWINKKTRCIALNASIISTLNQPMFSFFIEKPKIYIFGVSEKKQA